MSTESPRFNFLKCSTGLKDNQSSAETTKGGDPSMLGLGLSGITSDNVSEEDEHEYYLVSPVTSKENASHPQKSSENSIQSDALGFETNRNNLRTHLKAQIQIDDAQLLNEFDRYGFRKDNGNTSIADYDKWYSTYSNYMNRRRKKWTTMLRNMGMPLDSTGLPSQLPKKSEKLKRYVYKGIPSDWRGQSWWHFANGQELLNANEGVYESLQMKLITSNLIHGAQDLPYLGGIERDLYRTFPQNIFFRKKAGSTSSVTPILDADKSYTSTLHDREEPKMITSLRRVLLAFALYMPKIGYCQSLNFIAGLLLIFMDEEKAFWMLVIVTTKILPGVHEKTLEGVNVDQGVLLLSIKEYLPDVWNLIEPLCKDHKRRTSGDSISVRGFMSPHDEQNANNEDFLYRLPPVTLATANWFMCCFVGIVPIETTLRIWDCMFYDGASILFQFSLALFKCFEQELPKLPSSTVPSHSLKDEQDLKLFHLIQSYPKSLLNPRDFFDKHVLKPALTYMSLDQHQIDKCREYVSGKRRSLIETHMHITEIDKQDTPILAVSSSTDLCTFHANQLDNLRKDSLAESATRINGIKRHRTMLNKAPLMKEDSDHFEFDSKPVTPKNGFMWFFK